MTAVPTNTPFPTKDSSSLPPPNRLGRGINLGNALEAPNEGEWGVTLQEEYFRLIKEKGFDTVRIPVRWSTHAGKEPPYTVDAEFMRRVQWAVDQALENDLNAIVNMHHYEEMKTEPEANWERFLAIWDQVAAHFKDYPDSLVLEIMNEPAGEMKWDLWNKLYPQALEVIRKTNPTRDVIVGPADWNAIISLDDLILPDDDEHIILTVHYYLPFHFTHQGAEWENGSEYWLGDTWTAEEWQTKEIDQHFREAAAWAAKKNRPVLLGEFGVYNKAPMDQRALWTDFVARTAEAYNMSWAYWEFCAGFGIYDPETGEWREPLLNALIPQQP